MEWQQKWRMEAARICRQQKGECVSRGKRLTNIGGLLCLAGWLFILVHASQPFWSGKHILAISALGQDAVPITDFAGGADFAFHQKTKSGDVPKVIPLSLDASKGHIAIITKNWEPQYDMRWTPGLMTQDDKRFTYADGARAVPSTNPPRFSRRVANTPWGTYRESIYDLRQNQRYFLLLPQNSAWRGDAYSIEIRQRASENHILFLLLGFICTVAGMLLMLSQRKSGLEELDPIKLARTYQAQGRMSDAFSVLERAIATKPHRSHAIRKALDELNSSKQIS